MKAHEAVYNKKLARLKINYGTLDNMLFCYYLARLLLQDGTCTPFDLRATRKEHAGSEYQVESKPVQKEPNGGEFI